MKAGRTIIYWDACIFLAWLKDEPNDPGVMEGIEESVRQVHHNEAVLITSVMTQTEVLESKMPREAQLQFENLFKRRNVVWINHDTRVGKLSHEIRDYYSQRSVNLSSADCVHLASAILYKADVFYTLDGSGKKKRGTLLPLALTASVAGYKLNISKPYKSQLSLKLVPQEPKPKERIDEKSKIK